MKHLGTLAYIAALGMTVGLLTTGCSFQIGIDWQGKTAVDRKTYTPTVSYTEASDSNKQKLRY